MELVSLLHKSLRRRFLYTRHSLEVHSFQQLVETLPNCNYELFVRLCMWSHRKVQICVLSVRKKIHFRPIQLFSMNIYSCWRNELAKWGKVMIERERERRRKMKKKWDALGKEKSMFKANIENITDHHQFTCCSYAHPEDVLLFDYTSKWGLSLNMGAGSIRIIIIF